ncbi:MAG: PIN domain-containing protein [Planctomycetes bacterium]|nr:PIN domain-containing protein [Planctomycetota bacterium]
MSLGLDTSVVVRLTLGEPVELAGAALRRLGRARADGESVHVSDIVLAEAYVALQYHYSIPKADAVGFLRRLSESGMVVVHPRTLAALQSSSAAGLADRLILARHEIEGWKTLTCDRRQAKAGQAELIRAPRRS